MPKFRIGCHVSYNDIKEVPKYAKSIGCDMVQIFFGNPQQVVLKRKKEKDLIELSHQLANYKMKLLIHGSYAINLAHPVGTGRYNASVNAIVKDLEMIAIIGKRCMGLIIHMGKNVPACGIDANEAIKNYISGLKAALARSSPDTKIILETGASQGNEVGSRLESLSLIYWSLTTEERERIRFCIDTCHIWASGYDISTPGKVKIYFDLFDKLIGKDKIVCIHFNDSKTPLNSHVDRHADIGYGYIPLTGLKAVVKYAYKNKIPILLETPLDSVNRVTNKNVTFREELVKVREFVK